MTTRTTETRDLIARVRDGIAPADQPQTLRDLARTADGEPRVDAGMLRREAEIIEIRQCIERADRHGLTNRFGDDRTLLVALDAERDENDRLRARVAELEATIADTLTRQADQARWSREVEEMQRSLADGHKRSAYQRGAEALRERAANVARSFGFDAVADEIRALPLDDDAREDAQGQEVNER